METTTNKLSKDFLSKLYSSGLSMQDIADKLNKGHSTIVYYFDKHNIPRRSWSEATYVKRNPNGDPFKIKKNLSKEEAELRGLGVGLFWGEGNRAQKNSVRLGNTDPELIKKFIEFLQVICGVKKEKLKFQLQTFNNADPKKSI